MKTEIKDIIRSAMVSAGFEGRQRDFCRVTCIAPATFTRRMQNPDSITVAELRRIDRTAHIEDKELLKLIRGKK